MILTVVLAAFALIQCGSCASTTSATSATPPKNAAASVASATTKKPASISEVFRKNEIVSDVIPVAPAAVLSIKYTSGVEVKLGNELTPTKVKDQPKVEWKAEANAFYTLCMTDPDAPSRAKPVRREWHHWLVVNIPGSEVAKGRVLSEYVGSGPPKDTGLHRYVFLLYKQPKKLEFTEQFISKTNGSKRGGFSINKFAKKYSLGDPVAGNFYQAKYDDYVPTLHKQLKD